MSRIWVGWAGVVGVILMIWIGLGFFGTQALQYGLPVIALTIGALLLPNGELWWKGLCLLGGVIIAMIGFLLGAGVFPDNSLGYTLGGVVPVTIVALATMWTKKLSYFLAGVFGVAAFQAVYTAFFFSDPQSINFSMPLAFGITLAPMALTFLVFTLLSIFVPRFAKDGTLESADVTTATTTKAVESKPAATATTSTGKPTSAAKPAAVPTGTSTSKPAAAGAGSTGTGTATATKPVSGSTPASGNGTAGAQTSKAGTTTPGTAGKNPDNVTTTQMGVQK